MGRGIHEIDLRVSADGANDEVDTAEVIAELMLGFVVNRNDLVPEGCEVGLGLGVVSNNLHLSMGF